MVKAGLLAYGMMVCHLPSFPVVHDKPKPHTVAGAALALDPNTGHPFQIPVSVLNALRPLNTLHKYNCIASVIWSRSFATTECRLSAFTL